MIAIIKSTVNKKHKTMLMLAYSAGLRVSEVVSLKTANIDSTTMIITIRQAKGKKDRLAALSPVLLVMLREYAKEYKPLKMDFYLRGTGKIPPTAPAACRKCYRQQKRKLESSDLEASTDYVTVLQRTRWIGERIYP